MRGFRVQFFTVLESFGWWWTASPLDRMVFMQLFRISCEGGAGEVWVSGVGLCRHVGPDVSGEEVVAAYERLEAAGALENISDHSERWRYRVVGFERLAEAADTYRARARENYRKLREKQAVR